MIASIMSIQNTSVISYTTTYELQ